MSKYDLYKQAKKKLKAKSVSAKNKSHMYLEITDCLLIEWNIKVTGSSTGVYTDLDF